MRRTLLGLGCFSLLLAGCPGDDAADGNDTGGATESASNTDPDPTMSSMSGETMSDPSMSGTMTDPTDAMTTGGPACDPEDADAIQMCKDEAANQGQCPEVGDCNCDACVCELAACEADQGCTDIRECALETGCTGLDCLEEEFCGQVIEDAGGLSGASAMTALALSNCNEASGCPTQCPGETDGTSSGGETDGTSTGG